MTKKMERLADFLGNRHSLDATVESQEDKRKIEKESIYDDFDNISYN